MAVQEYLCEVKSFKMLTSTVFELGFETDKQLEFKGGQFISIVVPKASPSGKDLRRAYSIASPPQMRPIELCVKLISAGPGTTYLSQLKPGQTFRCFAPYGDFVYKPNPNRHVCFIATGTGVAPFRSMVFTSFFDDHPPRSATSVFGVRDASEILYQDEFLKKPFVQWIPALSRADSSWSGFRGRVTDYLKSIDFPWLETDYYLCGNGAMILEVKEMLKLKGVLKESIRQEIYYRA